MSRFFFANQNYLHIDRPLKKVHMSQEKALIVGGSTGRDLETVRRLLVSDVEVYIVSSNAENLAEAKQPLSSSSSVVTHTVYLLSRSDVDAFIRQIDRMSGAFDKLINAAGSFLPKPYLDYTREDYRKCLDLNESFFFISHAIARGVAARGNGSVVNIGSVWGMQAIKATLSRAYTMAKAGLHSMTQHLAIELGDLGVRINTVSPDVVRTSLYSSFIVKAKIKETLATFNSLHPIGCTGEPADIASVIDFSLSGEAS